MKFTHHVEGDSRDDTLSLEIWRDDDFEIIVTLTLEDKVTVLLRDPTKTYDSIELKEILELVVPFAVETALINQSVRKMDELNRKEHEGPAIQKSYSSKKDFHFSNVN